MPQHKHKTPPGVTFASLPAGLLFSQYVSANPLRFAQRGSVLLMAAHHACRGQGRYKLMNHRPQKPFFLGGGWPLSSGRGGFSSGGAGGGGISGRAGFSAAPAISDGVVSGVAKNVCL